MRDRAVADRDWKGGECIAGVLRGIQRGLSRCPRLLGACRPLGRAGLLPVGIWTRIAIEFPFDVRMPRGARFRYRSAFGDQIGRALFWRGLEGYEPETMRVLLRLARSSRLFLDIGANTGVHSLAVCAANRECRAYAFEPVPSVFARLKTNLEANGLEGRCTAVMAAVAERSGTTLLHVPRTAVPTSASLNPDGFRGCKGEVIRTNATTVDEILPAEAAVDLAKVDVEGFEDRVLLGMQRQLEQFRPDLIVECNADGPRDDVERILRRFGYRFFQLLPRGAVERRRLEPDRRERWRNYLCTGREGTIRMVGGDGGTQTANAAAELVSAER